MTDLCTKYRPTKFGEVVGQAVIVRSLKAVLDNEQASQFLFSGPSGTGKTTLARIAAYEVGCAPSDIQEVDAATYTGIDAMREITQALNYKPLGSSRAKALIINECQGLSKQAWDSLLTKVEEPPPWLFWFFTTTDMAKVPQAIKTRCTKYDLKPVSKDDLFGLLREIADLEKIDMDEAVMDLCVKAADGSPRAALTNMTACIGAKNKTDAIELLRAVEESAEAVELARALMEKKPWNVVRGILESLKDKNSPESVRHVVRAYLTAVIMGATKPNEAHFAALEAFSQPFPATDGISPLVLACGKLHFG